jgi:hypothetical protein
LGHHHHLGLLLAMTTHGDQYIFLQPSAKWFYEPCEPKIRVEQSDANQSVQGHTTNMHTATFFPCWNPIFFQRMCFWNIFWVHPHFLWEFLFLFYISEFSLGYFDNIWYFFGTFWEKPRILRFVVFFGTFWENHRIFWEILGIFQETNCFYDEPCEPKVRVEKSDANQ